MSEIWQPHPVPGLCQVKMIFESPQETKPSCLIAAIGTEFMPGVKEAIAATAEETAKHGWSVSFMAVKNLCIEPFRGLGAMRNWAAQEALAGGYDYLLTVDNDVLLEEKNTLIRLLNRGQLMVVPFYDQRSYQTVEVIGFSQLTPEFLPISEDDTDGTPWDYLGDPLLQPGQGLQPIRWAAVSCVLYNTVVFRYAGQHLWTDALISNEEAYYFMALRNLGIRLWQDTATRVSLLRGPTPVWKVLGRPNPNPVVTDA